MSSSCTQARIRSGSSALKDCRDLEPIDCPPEVRPIGRRNAICQLIILERCVLLADCMDAVVGVQAAEPAKAGE